MRQGFPILLISLLSFPLFTQGLFASETRVAATGGLTTLVDDETTDLNLFLGGNPAGLLYLNTKDRFDLSGEWSATDQEGPWGTQKTTILSTLPDPSVPRPTFGGVMVFPDPHWAFQATGQGHYEEGLPLQATSDTQNLSRILGMVRAAYATTFAVFGMEFSGIQNDRTFNAGPYRSGSEVLSGSSNEGRTFLRLGAAATFPENYSAEDIRFRAGLFWETPLGETSENRTLVMDLLSPPSFTVRQTWTLTHSTVQGAEILMEEPGILKARLSAEWGDGTWVFSQEASAPPDFTTTGPAPLYQYEDLTLNGDLRWTVPADEAENLKLGGGFTYLVHSQTSANVLYQVNDPQFEVRFGAGLDSPRDHLMGFQWTGFFPGNGQDRYRVAFGGEKWVASTWALRLGLSGEIDRAAWASNDTLTTLVDMGAGFEEAFGRMDLGFRLGQTVNMNDSSDTIGLIEAKATGTLFL